MRLLMRMSSLKIMIEFDCRYGVLEAEHLFSSRELRLGWIKCNTTPGMTSKGR